MKEIEIGNKKYNISCHASCYSAYNDKFNRNIMLDMEIARKFFNKQYQLAKELSLTNPKLSDSEIQDIVFKKTIDELDHFIDCITRLCWICIYDNDKTIISYNDWYDTLERLSLDDEWILEVLAITAECFR